jgi:hypothetical protein
MNGAEGVVINETGIVAVVQVLSWITIFQCETQPIYDSATRLAMDALGKLNAKNYGSHERQK